MDAALGVFDADGRVQQYITAGVTTVYHGRLVGRVGPDEPLDGLDVLPGFSIRLRDLLDEIAEDEAE